LNFKPSKVDKVHTTRQNLLNTFIAKRTNTISQLHKHKNYVTFLNNPSSSSYYIFYVQFALKLKEEEEKFKEKENISKSFNT